MRDEELSRAIAAIYARAYAYYWEIIEQTGEPPLVFPVSAEECLVLKREAIRRGLTDLTICGMCVFLLTPVQVVWGEPQRQPTDVYDTEASDLTTWARGVEALVADVRARQRE